MPLAEAHAAPADGAAARDACAHCGIPMPDARGLARQDEGPRFCCAGCETVHQMLRAGGLGAYYDMAERRGRPVAADSRAYDELDHAAYHRLYVTRRPDGILESTLYLEEIACASCVWLVERVPMLVPGLLRAELDVRRSRVTVAWDEAATRLSAVARTFDALGYRPHPCRGLRLEEARRREDRAAVARIGTAGAIATNVMLAALALYSGWFGGMEPAFERYFRWFSLLLATPALLGPGRVFFAGAWGALRARTVNMDVPIALALAAGYGRGLVNTVRDAGPIYFDGVTLLVFLLLTGRFLQQRAQRAAWDSAEILHSLAPATARVVDGAAATTVPAEALLPGAIVEVRAEETFPADGVVTEGRSRVDRSLLTGESRPFAVGPGDEVHAGTVNRGAAVRARVERAGEESRLGRILAEAEAGARRRAPIVALADRLAGAFVVIVLALAAATLALAWRGSPSDAVDRAIALLIVTCPCALALATPLAVSVAVGHAARSGILVRSGAALQALAAPGVVYLDKTGTLTEGRTALVAWEGENEAKAMVLALERHASHPIARGFEAAWASGAPPLEASDVRYVPGRGIEGVVAGRRVVVGTPAFAGSPAASGAGGAGTEGTPVWVSVDGRVIGRARFGDAIRPDAAPAVAALRARGYDLRILSGDDPGVAASVGAALGFAPHDCHAGASPEEKLRIVEDAEGGRAVVMVGDGVNDAAAMGRATVGVGVSGGAEACLASADVYLARPGLDSLVSLVDGARRTMRVVRRNMIFSAVYNVAGAALAMTGVINPLIAAILMPASSLTVVAASWRSRTFDDAPPRAGAGEARA